jgi:outer membrane lipoprotein carrier protein
MTIQSRPGIRLLPSRRRPGSCGKPISPKHLWRLGIVLFVLSMAAGVGARADENAPIDPLVDEILSGVEARYASSAFSARFDIESTLKAMQVTDTAEGRLMVKYPGKMRWEYEQPDPMLFITNGVTLWMYQPRENQVTVGQTDEVLGGSQGASFLSDVRLLRKQFLITLDPNGSDKRVRLKLTPREEAFDIAFVTLTVSRATHDVVEVVTTNQYDDTTRIVFRDIAFQQAFPDTLFDFEIPEGTDVLQF